MEKGFFIKSEELSTMMEQAATKAVEKFIKVTKPATKEGGQNSVLLRGYGDLCKFFGFSKTTAIKLKQDGQIPFIQRGRVLYFKSDEVLKALSK